MITRARLIEVLSETRFAHLPEVLSYLKCPFAFFYLLVGAEHPSVQRPLSVNNLDFISDVNAVGD